MRKLVIIAAGITALAFTLFVVTVYALFGGSGAPFPDLRTPPTLAADQLKMVAELPQPPGNIAVSSSGRIFFTYHPESHAQLKVLELVDGQPVPYPSAEIQSPKGETPSFDTVFSVRISSGGSTERLWTLDHGFHGIRRPRLLAFDIATRKVVFDLLFSRDVAGLGSFLQDMQISPDGKTVYISDTGVLNREPSLILVDVATKRVRRLLVGHPVLQPEPFTINARGKPMVLLGGLFWMHPGFDPIVLDRSGEWLYVGPMSGRSLYRIRTADLLNDQLSAATLATRVERYADKPQSDGLTIADDGTIYLTGIEHGAIFTIDPQRKLATLIENPRLRWPDGMSFGPKGDVYVTDSALGEVMLKSQSAIAAAAPFHIWRFSSGKTARAGQ